MSERIGEILIRGDEIAGRVQELARQLAPRYTGRRPVFVAIMHGCRPFATDLARAWPEPVPLECVAARSYDGTTSGELTVTIPETLGPKVAGRPVLLIDDIYDSGRTLATVRRRVEALGPSEVRTLVLLRKRHRTASAPPCGPGPDWIGFEIEDRFVVGYGLDLHDRYRDLPYVAVLEEAP